MRRLKVLFITAWYPSSRSPLAGVYVREHAKAVQLLDDVTVLHCAGREPALRKFWRLEGETDHALTEGIPTYRLWEPQLPLRASYLGRLWGTWQALGRLALDGGSRPDIIHAHGYPVGLPAVLAARLCRAPLLVTEHSTEFPRRLLPPARLWGARLAFGSAAYVLPVSQSLAQAIAAYGIRARFRVIPNAIDTSLFQAAVSDAPPDGTPHILFVGILDPSHKKGVPTLLQALSQVKEARQAWHLDIVGDGPARPQYERLAVELGIAQRVTFHGYQPRVETARLMAACAFFVLPSVYETFGVVVIEALASGKPVIVTRCGGPEEFVDAEAGLIVPPSDVPALAAALCQMLDHYADYPAARLADYVERRFSYRAVGQVLDDVYRSVLEP